jgi:hypothetical protein
MILKRVLKHQSTPSKYALADGVVSAGDVWIEQQWEAARQVAHQAGEVILAIDEIQKIPNWSETASPPSKSRVGEPHPRSRASRR